MLAGCSLAMVLALTVARPIGQFAVGGLNPLTTLQQCVAGTISLAHLYEQLNVAMLVPFALFGTLATRRPLLIVASCVLVSGLVEFVQGATGGGQCQARDVVHNAVGGLMGVLLAAVVLWLRTRRSGGVTAGLEAGSGSLR